MKLVSFSVENYRSITKARKIGVSDYTLLIGPNNEGKSNILRALALAMETLAGWTPRRVKGKDGIVRLLGPPRTLLAGREAYNWDRDFPIPLQEKKPTGSSNITLEFELTQKEIDDFKEGIKSNLNGTLPIKFEFSGTETRVSIAKPGRGSVTLNKRTDKIAQFVSNRLSFEYIPAVRTGGDARNIIDRLVQAELRPLMVDEEYKNVIQKMHDLQKPILDELAKNITKTISTFLPSVKSVKLEHELSSLHRMRNRVYVSVDDGVETTLDLKGDGVQSLLTLALMQHASEAVGKKRDYVFAIEEPEAHLHPEACHALRKIISSLSEERQVVLSSHSPLFVNRSRVTNNIIVTGNKAKPAKNIAEIRAILGVQCSDNLRNAELVLMCEGEDDKICIEAILGYLSNEINQAIKNGRFIIEQVAGAGNFSYKAGTYLGDLCRVHFFIDDDDAGTKAYKKTLRDHKLEITDFHFAKFPSLDESEMEDLINREIYTESVSEKFGVDLEFAKPNGRTAKSKWSNRMKWQFERQGKPWNKDVEMKLKCIVANCVSADPANAIHEQANDVIVSLIKALEKKI